MSRKKWAISFSFPTKIAFPSLRMALLLSFGEHDSKCDAVQLQSSPTEQMQGANIGKSRHSRSGRPQAARLRHEPGYRSYPSGNWREGTLGRVQVAFSNHFLFGSRFTRFIYFLQSIHPSIHSFLFKCPRVIFIFTALSGWFLLFLSHLHRLDEIFRFAKFDELHSLLCSQSTLLLTIWAVPLDPWFVLSRQLIYSFVLLLNVLRCFGKKVIISTHHDLVIESESLHIGKPMSEFSELVH